MDFAAHGALTSCEHLETGGCLIIKPSVAFDLSDARQRKAISCESLALTHDGYVVEHGGTGEPTELLIGRFSFDAVAAEPLVAPMPPLVHVSLERRTPTSCRARSP